MQNASAKPLQIPSPQITVGIPAYNGEQYLRRALDAVLAQTFADIRVIISDNASTDSTPEICAEYAAKDPRVEVYRQAVNQGHVPNFTFLLNQAQSEFFIWAACDDIWQPRFLEVLLDDLRSNPEAGVAMTAVERVYSDGEPIDVVRFSGDDNPNQQTMDTMLHGMMTGKLYHHWVYGLYRTKFLKRAMKVGWTKVYAPDRIFMTQIALASPLRYVDEVLFVRTRDRLPFAARYPEDNYTSKTNRSILKGWLALAKTILGSDVIPLAEKLRFIAPALSLYGWQYRKNILKALTPRFRRKKSTPA